MKKIILFIFPSFLVLSSSLIQGSFAQTVYDVTPGIKGCSIVLSLANISEIKNAECISVKISKSSINLIFNKNEEFIKKIEPGTEAEASFLFDIKRGAPVNHKDTIEFLVTDGKTILIKKQFILSFSPPKEYKLEQNYPNPFNPYTTIMYQLPYESKVTLKVYDILGGEAASLVNEVQTAGYKEVKFGGSKFSSGVYICRITAESPKGNYISIKKMMMVK